MYISKQIGKLALLRFSLKFFRETLFFLTEAYSRFPSLFSLVESLSSLLSPRISLFLGIYRAENKFQLNVERVRQLESERRRRMMQPILQRKEIFLTFRRADGQDSWRAG